MEKQQLLTSLTLARKQKRKETELLFENLAVYADTLSLAASLLPNNSHLARVTLEGLLKRDLIIQQNWKNHYQTEDPDLIKNLRTLKVVYVRLQRIIDLINKDDLNEAANQIIELSNHAYRFIAESTGKRKRRIATALLRDTQISSIQEENEAIITSFHSYVNS